MEKELNIAAILKDKPKGIKLYSPMIGECFFKELLSSQYPIFVGTKNRGFWHFQKDGKFEEDGECMLFPSKQMRDWSKFSWKKGDVLAHNYGLLVMFDSWANDKYTEFYTAYSHYPDSTIREKEIHNTSCFSKVSEDIRKKFIDAIEEHYGGKLNLSTLEIEKPKQEFKDGDIVQIGDDTFVILKRIEPYKIYYHYYYKNGITSFNGSIGRAERSLKFASKADQLTILSHLKEYEKKQWDAEKKAIVDLPKKYEFKTMDYFLARYNYSKDALWNLYQYAFTDKDGYIFVVNESCIESDKYTCIPYNEQTAHLLGTTEDWKGGEE